MPTLKEVAATVQLISQVGLERALVELKTYIDNQDSSVSTVIQSVQSQLNSLIGTEDADKVLNTFNEIKAFLADYTEDDTLKSLIDAVNNAVAAEQTRATDAESALGSRITTIENVNVMTSEQAKALFDSVFAPSGN